ncbi:MAG: hypothetical protein ACKE8G_02930 [Methylophagaceae bacterium]
MKDLLILFIVMLACWQLFGPDAVVELGPGVMVAEIPKQTDPLSSESFEYHNYQITPLADFEIKAKILSKANYSLGRQADLSPVDLALGWQNMSDESVLEKLTISQANRWYMWRTQELPIPKKQIEIQSANMHIVPANAQIEKEIAQAKQGEIIELSGHLIRIDADDGWYWQSSLTRDDIGDGGCELMYVKDVHILDM